MIIRTAKDAFTASTFAALARHQANLQGAFARIEIGGHTVDVADSDDTAEDYAARTLEEISDALEALRDEASAAGDAEQVRLCDLALNTDIEALEACCAVICAAADAQD